MRRRFTEALTITVGILAAFAIDAWWDGVQETRTDRANLESVLRELRTTSTLLDDAVRLHSLTQETAIEVLEIIETGRVTIPVDSLEVLIMTLWNSYVINAPTGALEAATLAGTVARLEDETLKDLLLGWDSLIEDLLEEEVNGSANALRFARDFMGSYGATHSLATAYRSSVSGEVVGGLRTDLPSTRHEMDWDVLIRDPAFETELLFLLLFAQASQEEAVAFRETLTNAIHRLASALDDGY